VQEAGGIAAIHVKQDTMYLAAIPEKQWYRFLIRESYWDHDCYRSRDLVELGPDPSQYIVYPGGRAYYIDPELEDRIRIKGGHPDPDELDDLLWPFVDEYIRHAVGAFRERQSPPAQPTVHSARQPVHLFDKRRIHFLRFGRMDQGPIGRVPAKILRPVRNRSRDEIEQYFLHAERILKAHERKAYVYVIFDLQRFFNELCAKTMPEALDPEAVDTYFVQELCRLNADNGFWAGMPVQDHLGDYLVRYLIMYFDLDYGRSDVLENLFNQFRNAHRRHKWPEQKKRVSFTTASSIFGVAADTLKQMSRREFSRLFRQKAMELHPDQGGRQRDFIRLSEAYKSIMQTKR
jgi:hypothetical protein